MNHINRSALLGISVLVASLTFSGCDNSPNRTTTDTIPPDATSVGAAGGDTASAPTTGTYSDTTSNSNATGTTSAAETSSTAAGTVDSSMTGATTTEPGSATAPAAERSNKNSNYIDKKATKAKRKSGKSKTTMPEGGTTSTTKTGGGLAMTTEPGRTHHDQMTDTTVIDPTIDPTIDASRQGATTSNPNTAPGAMGDTGVSQDEAISSSDAPVSEDSSTLSATTAETPDSTDTTSDAIQEREMNAGAAVVPRQQSQPNEDAWNRWETTDQSETAEMQPEPQSEVTQSEVTEVDRSRPNVSGSYIVSDEADLEVDEATTTQSTTTQAPSEPIVTEPSVVEQAERRNARVIVRSKPHSERKRESRSARHRNVQASDAAMMRERQTRSQSGVTARSETASRTDSGNIPENATGTSLSATSEADRIRDLNNPAKDLEPQSRYPDKTGSTSITGVPRSHAQAVVRPTVFTDPSVAPLRSGDMTMEKHQNVSTVNLEQYPFTRRSDFKSDMSSRLDSFESRIDNIRVSVAEEPKDSRAGYRDMVKNLERKHEAAQAHLKHADKIPSAEWDKYKREFRDQVSELERTYDSLQTAMQ